MKKFKKALSIILSVILIATMLAGCGNKTKNTTLSKYLSNGETIWYIVQSDNYANVGKDSQVTDIMVFYDDGTFIEADVDKTLGAVENMKDSEIIELVEQRNKENIDYKINNFLYEIKSKLCPIYTVEQWEVEVETFFEYHYEECKPDGSNPFSPNDINLIIDDKQIDKYDDNSEIWGKCKEIIANNVLDCYSTRDYKTTANNIYNELTQYIESTQIYKDRIAKIQEFIDNPVLEYKLVVNTDETGNNVGNESIVVQHLSASYVEMYITSIEIELFTIADKESEHYPVCYEIYDSYYAGFNNMDSQDKTLLTRVDKEINFVYDEMGAKNTTTDNADTVFEKIMLYEADKNINEGLL